MANQKSDSPDSTDKSGTEAADKGSDLSARLKEFSDATHKSASTKDEGDRIANLEKQLAAYQEAEATRSYRKEMDDFMVPAVAGDLEVHPKLVETWLNEQADRDPKLREIWANRNDDRAAFEEAVESLKPKFEAYAEKEGLKGTTAPKGKDAQARLQSAVRSARQTSSEPGNFNSVDYSKMSDTDFELHKQEVFRLQSSGQLN